MHNTIIEIIQKLCNQKFKDHKWIIYFWTKRFGSTIWNELLNTPTPFRANISTLSKCRILLRNHSVRASSIHLAFGLRTTKEEIHSRKFTPTPKFLGTAKRYLVCHIGQFFQIPLIYAFIGYPYSVVPHNFHFQTSVSLYLEFFLLRPPSSYL